jgi:hypothetical protein
MSVGTWYLIATKGVQAFRSQKRSRDFLAAFWRAPNLDAVATPPARERRERALLAPRAPRLHRDRAAQAPGATAAAA